MFFYFIMYLFSFILALSYQSKIDYSFPLNPQAKKSFSKWFFLGLVFTLIIGYRDQVGGDWWNYLRNFNRIDYYTFEEIIKRSDPGYYSINWLLSDWGYEIYSVNLVCGAIFMTGLIIFSVRQPNPWLALSVSIPYLIIVIAMGYTRQAVALGFLFWGLVALEKEKFKQFIVLMVLAATFHKSAVLMIGLGVFIKGGGKLMRAIAVFFIGYGIYNAFLANYQQDLWLNYVEVQMQSQGAQIRVMMNLIPSLIFVLFRKEWAKQFNDATFWIMISLGALASVVLVNFASTAVDRVALYFTPIQVVVYSRLPYLLRGKFNPQIIVIGILLFYALVLFVWLNYATHSIYWVPYNNLLFDGIV